MRNKTARLFAVGASAFYMAAACSCFAGQAGNGVEPVRAAARTARPYEPVTIGETADAGSWRIDSEESEILLRIAMAEAEGESTEGKALVMLVVMNRVGSDMFPDSIEEVVFQNAGGTYQFSPVAPGGRYWTAEPDEDCRDALELVLGGWDGSRGAMYFEGCAGESWHSRNLELLFECGGHRFYK